MDKVDVAIIGAGPVGLTLLNLLAGSGLRLAVVEQQAAALLAQPAFDGREIALTHASRNWLEQAGIWSRLDQQAIWPLRKASVRDRHLPFALDVATAVPLTVHRWAGWCPPGGSARRPGRLPRP